MAFRIPASTRLVIDIGIMIVLALMIFVLIGQNTSETKSTENVEAVSGAEDEDSLPPALADLDLPDAEVIKVFDTGVDGVTGLVVGAGGEQNLVYSLNGGKEVVIGMMLAEGGKNLTEKHAATHLPPQRSTNPTQQMPQRESDALDAEQALGAMQELDFYIEEGNGERVLYVTLDPNCPHCANYYRQSRSVLDQVKIRWVPVGILGPDSMRQAGLLVEADNPQQALAQMMEAGLSGKPGRDGQKAAHANTQALQRVGIAMTPVTVYAIASDKAQVIRGALNAEQIGRLGRQDG